MATHVQDFWTSRNKLVDGQTRIGKLGRLWFEPDSETIRVGNGEPGGKIVGGGSSTDFLSLTDTPDVYYMTDSFIKVNNTNDGLIFSNKVDGGNF